MPQVFLVWSCPSSGITQATDTFAFDGAGKIIRQNIVVWRDSVKELAEEITKAAFKRKLVIETSVADDQVIKTLCPLTVTEDEINHAMDVLKESVEEVMKDRIKRGDANSVSSLAG